MKDGLYVVFIVLPLVAACSGEDAHNSSMQKPDSTNLVSTHRALEKVVKDYYVSVEQDIRTDLGVSEAEIIDRVQSLINDGYIKKPVILLITENGPKWEVVDYPTYKEFMSDHAVNSRRFHRIQPDVGDRLVIDSIRSELLRALKAKSVDVDGDETVTHSLEILPGSSALRQ